MKKAITTGAIIFIVILALLLISNKSYEITDNVAYKTMYNTAYKAIDNVDYLIVYEIPYEEGKRCSLKKLEQLNSQTIEELNVTYNNEMVLWKGDKFGLLYLKNNKKIKARVSVYGNFFSITNKRGYYSY